MDLAYLFEGGHLSGDKLHDLLSGRRLAFFDHNESLGHFTGLLVRNTDDGGVRDGGVAQQQTLKLGGRHLKGLVFDQFFLAVQHPEIPVFIGAHDVAGVQPAVGGDGLRRGLGVIEIALHHLGAAHQ